MQLENNISSSGPNLARAHQIHPARGSAECTGQCHLFVVSYLGAAAPRCVVLCYFPLRIPWRSLGEIAKEHGIPLHVDAAQAVGKIPVDVKELGIAAMSISGHKVDLSLSFFHRSPCLILSRTFALFLSSLSMFLYCMPHEGVL